MHLTPFRELHDRGGGILDSDFAFAVIRHSRNSRVWIRRQQSHQFYDTFIRGTEGGGRGTPRNEGKNFSLSSAQSCAQTGRNLVKVKRN